MHDDLAGESNSTPEEIADYYDAWASADYDADVAAWGYEAPEVVAAQLAEHLSDSSSPILDAGCGTGRVGAALHAQGLRNLSGGDFTPASVEAARSRGVYQAVDHLDLNQRLTFDDDSFAAVVSIGVFSYIHGVDATLRELLRVAQPGGVVIFTQRTDLWDERDCPGVLASLAEDGVCTVTMSDPSPYLPDHPDFASDIIYTTLTKT